MSAAEPIAIRAERLGKRFRLGRRPRGGLLRQGLGHLLQRGDDAFWALRDVSFEVRRGEALGIVGRNGAGKSTLLKILSRITDPSEGRAEIRGRVGCLLEVGTGFHPELSGRENVFLNGAILGMRRAEIAARFDEIVAFSGVEAFLDTPVKRYSSGMRMRLAFAVAAHLEPEILIIDEVLAVGDEEFQKKCLGKMSDVAGAGRTVLFVSHNLAAVRALCPRALLLERGAVAAQGSADRVVDRYLADAAASAEVPLRDRTDRRGSGRLRFTRLRVLGGEPGEQGARPASGQPLRVALDYTAPRSQQLRQVRVALVVTDESGSPVFSCDTRFRNADFSKLPASGALVCRIPSLPLAAGRYQLNLWSTVADEVADAVPHAAGFRVEHGDFYATGRTTEAHKHGPVLVAHDWSEKGPEVADG